MKIDLNEYKKYECNKSDRNFKMVGLFEIEIDKFHVGTMLNLVDEKEYEIYLYIIDQENKISLTNLLLTNCEDYNKAKEVFYDNCDLIKNNDIIKILESLK